MTIKTTGIQKRGDKYYLRIRVPEECQATLGKKEVVKSLGTSDEAEALRAAQDLRAEWNAVFDKRGIHLMQVEAIYCGDLAGQTTVCGAIRPLTCAKWIPR